MATVLTVITVILVVWFGGGIIHDWREARRTTKLRDARMDEQEVESSNAALVHELGSVGDTQRYAAASSSGDATESEPEPTPTPLSPWLDDPK